MGGGGRRRREKVWITLGKRARIMEIKRRSIWVKSVENLLGKRLWTCHNTDY
jgi:hypothetical protein